MKHCGTVLYQALVIALLISTLALGLRLSGYPAASASVSTPAGPVSAGGASSQIHDIAVASCIAEGPPSVELSDPAGANMYLACDIKNQSDHDDMVEITAGDELLQTALSDGCVANGSLVIPGRTDFVMPAGEVKRALYKVNFECHAPAVPSISPISIAVTAEHTAQADGTDDGNPGNNTITLVRSLLIGPGPTPTPPPPDADSDGDGFTDAAEEHIGTVANEPCGNDGWPADLVETGLSFNTLDVQDMASFIAPVRRVGRSPGDTAFDLRWDLVPGAVAGDHINSEDMAALTSGPTGYPPMFDGQRAFGKTCPATP
jgi:hypothetical protein